MKTMTRMEGKEEEMVGVVGFQNRGLTGGAHAASARQIPKIFVGVCATSAYAYVRVYLICIVPSAVEVM